MLVCGAALENGEQDLKRVSMRDDEHVALRMTLAEDLYLSQHALRHLSNAFYTPSAMLGVLRILFPNL